tara:strand:+ start:306 stop:1070 length:765 start_codon:yes stop_codon:yes gene_type:complete
MANKKAEQQELTVAKKLEQLAMLQKLDSSIDEIKILRGELPLEVQDLEDEVEGLTKRLENFQNEVDEKKENINHQNEVKKEAELLIKKYEKDQMKVRNNREFDAINKELEYQTLEIELADKKIKESEIFIEDQKIHVSSTKSRIKEKKSILKEKKSELDDIIKKTEKDEEKLERKRNKIKKQIEERLIFAYDRIRSGSRNGLAVVPINRGACGGCFNKVTAQVEMEVKNKKKIIVCEHCGRIFCPPDIWEKYFS